MTQHVVDTNVPVVANGRHVTATPACQERAVLYLLTMAETGCVMIDSGGQILSEYKKRLSGSGQPGTGDMFYLHILMNQGNRKRVFQHDLDHPRSTPLQEGFAKGTLRKFDGSDRPFALCAAVSRKPVATCTDSDWTDHETGLGACGVTVEYICDRAAAVKTKKIKKNKQRKNRRKR